MYLLGYLLLAIAGMLVLMLVGPFQIILFVGMIVVIVVSLVVFFWTRPPKSSGTAQPSLAAQNAATVTVGHVVRSLVRALRRSKPATVSNPNQQVGPNQGP
jgi:NADH:ubiquinone oxidoreductase subunit 6 (subunit J)